MADKRTTPGKHSDLLNDRLEHSSSTTSEVLSNVSMEVMLNFGVLFLRSLKI